MKKYLVVLVKCSISLVLIWMLLSEIDLVTAFERAETVRVWPLFFVFIIFVTQMTIGGARWGFVLRAIGTPLDFFKTTKLFYIGAFFSQVLPSSVGGDAVRMFMSYKLGLPLPKAINGVIIERIVTLVGLAILIAFILPSFTPKLDIIATRWVLLIFSLLILGLFVGIILLSFLDKLPQNFSKFKLFRGLVHLAKDTRSVFFNSKSAGCAVGWGIATHVCISTYVFSLGLSLNLELTWVDCLILIPPVMLVTTIPISIAGWGVRETAMVAAMGLIGVPSDAALVLSILFGFSTIVWTLPAALIWILGRSQTGQVSFNEIEQTINTNNAESSNI